MGIAEKIVVFILAWWLTLFAVLPWGVRSQVEAEDVVPGSEPGAPAKPLLVKKLIVTTLIATAISLVAYHVIPHLMPY